MSLIPRLPSRQKSPQQPKGDKVLPGNWPEDIDFLTDQTYSERVLAEQLNTKLSRGSSDDESWIKISANLIVTPSPLVKIVTITDEKHPAYGQRGLFAAEHLQPDQFILLVSSVKLLALCKTDPDRTSRSLNIWAQIH